MVVQDIKFAFRVLYKQKANTFINVFGIGLSVAVCLLIGLYIDHETGFDKYHTKQDRIYRLAAKEEGAGFENGIAKVSAPWGPGARQHVPEVEDVCRFLSFGEGLFTSGDKKFYESDGFYADSTTFKIFSWKLVKGDKHSVLKDANTIVLTRSFANKYFGSADPLGKTIVADKTPYLVTGLMENVPANSHFTFDFLVSMGSYSHPDMDKWDRWNQFYTYLLLKPNVSAQLTKEKIDNLLANNLDSATSASITPILQPLSKIHLHSDLFREIEANSDVKYIYIFGTLALFIILIASLNFINLSTAQAIKRSNEIAVRKVNGASRQSLVWQFLIETTVVCTAAVLLAIIIAYAALPFLNNLLNKQISFDWFSKPQLFMGLLGLVVLLCFLSGIYPALVLSSFKPIQILGRKATASAGGNIFRKALVVGQFSISIVMIIAAFVCGLQLDYIRSKNLGFNKEQIIIIPFHDAGTAFHLDAVKEQLKNIPGIASIAASANRPGGSDWAIPYAIPGLDERQLPAMRNLVIDEDFFSTYQMTMAAGRSFDKRIGTDTNAYVINEEAARQLGIKDPLGKMMSMPAIGRAAGPIVGVVKDFHFRSLHEKIAPLSMFIESVWATQLSVRINSAQVGNTLELFKQKWQEIEPGSLFTYSFFDEEFGEMYQSESRTTMILYIFAAIAIFIACLGLFGLASFTAQQRVREIGIRKILGASVASVVSLLSKDFLKLVIVALVLAIPIAWYVMNKWLQVPDRYQLVGICNYRCVSCADCLDHR
jgi:putative ABC transport system permease protein